MKLSTKITILVVSAVIVAASFKIPYIDNTHIYTTKPIELAPVDLSNEKSLNLPPNNSQITVQGKIVKETIPAELELGENWYWIYFDTPFFLQDNASGRPQYVDKIQVIPRSEKTNIPTIDTLLNIHVEVVGELTWGYAESRVIQIISTKEII